MLIAIVRIRRGCQKSSIPELRPQFQRFGPIQLIGRRKELCAVIE